MEGAGGGDGGGAVGAVVLKVVMVQGDVGGGDGGAADRVAEVDYGGVLGGHHIVVGHPGFSQTLCNIASYIST